MKISYGIRLIVSFCLPPTHERRKKRINLFKTIKRKIKSMFTEYWAKTANVVKAGYRSNAFAPLVWFNSIVDPILIAGSIFTSEPVIKIIFIIIVAIIILLSVIMYVVLFLKDPKLLQSEEFRIEDKKLDLIASKSEGITIVPVNLTTPSKQIDEGGQNA
jgi:hypothetical protein